MDLQDKIVAVTGAGSGLGREIAVQLSSKGVIVELLDLHKPALLETQSLCETTSHIHICDVTSEFAVRNVFIKIENEDRAIHGLINNAGITRDSLFVKAKDNNIISTMSLDDFQAVIDVNLTGSFICAREAAIHMIKTKSEGCIINISSISKDGNVGQTNYAASKAGVVAMSNTWAKELARYNIRANSIAPGFIGTGMVNAMPDKIIDSIVSKVPISRLGTPKEIALTVMFILENDYVNGHCLEVNGGLRI
jgi:3-oxoacyl-[acyl-carrier protein] reductase